MKNKYLVSSVLIAIFSFCACTTENIEEPKVIIIPSVPTTLYNGIECKFSATTDIIVDEVSFYFNGENIGSTIKQPYEIKYTPKDKTPGENLITIIAKLNGKSYSAEQNTNIVLRLGDEYQGGKIFFLENSGEHGLIGSTTDLVYNSEFGDEIRFYWGNETLLGTSNNNGQQNTALMANAATSSGYAGYHFKNGGYSQNGFSDWYIPSIEELEVLKENKSYVGGFPTVTDWQAQYWSSSEQSETKAFILNFNALMGNTNDKIKVFKIRPIRKF